MKKIIVSLFLLFSIRAISQNVVIDYQAWNPSGTTCNLFVNPTNVPATGTPSGTIEHQRKLGETVYNSSDLSIQIRTEYQTTGGVYKGGRYRIAYNFKAGYSYTIYITAAAVENTVGFPTGPFVRADINSIGGGGSTGCNGPETLNYNAGGSPAAVKLSSDVFLEYQLIFPQIGNQSNLEITAFPATDGGIKTVRIKKIRIVETPPPPTFTLSPSPTLDVPLGTNLPQTFTVTNVYNSPGVTSYEWNLGSASNGWTYNGSPAPQNISTTTNTLTLTPEQCSSLNNVAVTVRMNNSNYQTLNTTVTRSIPPANTFSISGPNEFCSSGNYTIAGGSLCGATVTWSLEYLANHPNVASLSCTNCSSTTLTKINNGTVLLIATVTFPNSTTYTYEKYIGVGTPVIRGWYNSPTNSSEPLNPSSRFQFNWNDACYTQYINTNMDISANATVVWEDAGNSGGVTWSQVGNNLRFYFSDIDQWAYFRVITTNSCGSQSVLYRFRSVGDNCSGGTPLRIMLSPNPSNSNVAVSLAEKGDNKKTKEILEIRIMDKLGMIKQKWTYNKQAGGQPKQINISTLSPDIYTIMVFDGKVWTTDKLLKQ